MGAESQEHTVCALLDPRTSGIDAASLRPHPAAALFPLMSDAELQQLSGSLAKVGLQRPITIVGSDGDWLILDGRNRLRACAVAGVEVRFEVYEGDDPIGFVAAMNLARRHLNETQRAMIAAELKRLYAKEASDRSKSNLRQFTDPVDRPTRGESRTLAANAMNVGTATVTRAENVLRHGAPEVIEAVRSSRVKVNDASNAVAHADHDAQRAALAQVLEGSARTMSQAVARATGTYAEPAVSIADPMKQRYEEADRKRAVILQLHRNGHGTTSIAEKTGLKRSTVSMSKIALGISSSSPPIKLRADIDRVTTMLSGTAEYVEQLCAILQPSQVRFEVKEVRSWIKSLSDGARAIRLLQQTLRAKQESEETT